MRKKTKHIKKRRQNDGKFTKTFKNFTELLFHKYKYLTLSSHSSIFRTSAVFTLQFKGVTLEIHLVEIRQIILLL